MYKALVKMRNKKGFTLMELLIVVAIIAILAAIAIPTFSSSLEKAKRGADEANARSLYAAVALNVMTDGKLGAGVPKATVTGPATVSVDGTDYKFNYDVTIAYTAPTSADTTWVITVKGADGANVSWTVKLPKGTDVS